MEVYLPPDLQQFVTDQVSQGHFISPSDAVCHAVASLREQERRRVDLKQELEIGLAQARRGEVRHVNAEAVKAEGRRRLSIKQAE